VATDPHARLAELGLSLPSVSPPGGAYVPAVRSNGYVYVAGQVPMTDGKLITAGRVGAEVTAGQARELCRTCALAALAAIDYAAGLARVIRIVKVTGFISSAPEFTGQADVLNGASELFIAVLGDRGRHARSVVGVPVLPLGAPVEVEVMAEVTD
jgi:enamine deaminase RidA (YjgF/YER057c/UK114 family)